MKRLNIFYSPIFIVLVLLLTDSTGIRVRGGTSRTTSTRTGSNSWGSSSSSTSRFSSGGGSSWKSAAKGAVAALIFAKMARSGLGYGGMGYGGVGGYRYGSYRTRYANVRGDFCENYEDFNGTTIGEFQCPLDDFNSNDVYCCGEDDFEYCCSFFDDTGRTVGVVVGVIAFVLLVGLTIFCCCRFKKRFSERVPFFRKRGNNGGPAGVPLRPMPAARPQAYPNAPPPPYPGAAMRPPYGGSAAAPTPAYPNSNFAGPRAGAPPPPGFTIQ